LVSDKSNFQKIKNQDCYADINEIEILVIYGILE